MEPKSMPVLIGPRLARYQSAAQFYAMRAKRFFSQSCDAASQITLLLQRDAKRWVAAMAVLVTMALLLWLRDRIRAQAPMRHWFAPAADQVSLNFGMRMGRSLQYPIPNSRLRRQQPATLRRPLRPRSANIIRSASRISGVIRSM